MELTKELVEEHKLIKRMICVLEKAVVQVEKGADARPALFIQMIDFIRGFADTFHHAKEEDILFREMVRKGMPEKSSPIEAMLIEHDEGRAFVRGMIGALEKHSKGDTRAKKNLAENARGYIDLLRQHIEKEDDILYPVAERMFTDDEKLQQFEEYKKAEAKKGGSMALNRYKKLVEELENDFGIVEIEIVRNRNSKNKKTM